VQGMAAQACARPGRFISAFSGFRIGHRRA
jgi:hypothetical protein